MQEASAVLRSFSTQLVLLLLISYDAALSNLKYLQLLIF